MQGFQVVPDLRDRLNAQAGRIGWQELQPSFDRGLVIRIAEELDLVEVAAAVVEDDCRRLSGWLEGRLVAKATVEEARAWQHERRKFWALPSTPWMLVQVATAHRVVAHAERARRRTPNPPLTGPAV